MKRLKFITLSLSILSYANIFGWEDSGLIFFTNFIHYKFNERNFEPIFKASLMEPIKDITPDVPEIPKPENPLPDTVPDVPAVKPTEPPLVSPEPENPSPPAVAPEPPTPVVPPKYVFLKDAWYDESEIFTEDFIIDGSEMSSGEPLDLGMGTIKPGFSVTNQGNLEVINSEIDAVLSGMISIDGGDIRNEGSIKVSGSSTIFSALGMGAFAESTTSTSIQVENSGIIEVADSNIGMFGLNSSTLTNSGHIDVNGGIGLYIYGPGSIANNSGNLTVSASPFGIYSENGGTINNSGTISMSGNTSAVSGIAMASYGSGEIYNLKGGTVVVQDNQIAMYGSGSSNLINEGTLDIYGGRGIYLKGTGTSINRGNIVVTNGGHAMGLSGGGTAENRGNITLTASSSGMLVQGSGNLINSGNISFSDRTNYGVLLLQSTDAANFINTSTGNITGKDAPAIFVHGSGIAVNEGTIDISGSKAAVIVKGSGSITNRGTITFSDTTYGMLASDGGTIIQDSDTPLVVQNGSSAAMAVLNSGNLINRTEVDATFAQTALYLTGSATGTNSGTIRYSMLGYGVILDNTTSDAMFINEGLIDDEYPGPFNSTGGGSAGIVLRGSGTVKNYGTIINDSGLSGISIDGNGYGYNYETGVITVTGNRFGMKGSNGATLYNYGTIDVIPQYDVVIYPNGGMYLDGYGVAVNYGNISVGGSNFNGMASSGDNTIINGKGGTIEVLDNSSSSSAFYMKGGKAINYGTVKLGTGALLVTGGTLQNWGHLDAPNGIRNGTGGSLIMEKGGTSSTVLSEATIGFSYFPDFYSKGDTNYIPANLTFRADKIISPSYIYEVSGTSDSLLVRRKSFTEISESGIGNYLEKIYFDDNNSHKDRFFSYLKESQTSRDYDAHLNTFFGRDLYPILAFQTRDIVKFTTDNILNNLEKKLPPEKKFSWVVGYIFENYRDEGFDNVEGYKESLNGFYLGSQFRYDSFSDWGAIFSYTRSDSKFYSNLGKRDDNFFQGTLFKNYEKDDMQGIAALYVGYGSGDLTRRKSYLQEESTGNLKNFYVGASGKVSKKYNLNSFFLEPEGKIHTLGIFQKNIGETGGEFPLEVSGFNKFFSRTSLLLGVGKDFK